MIDECIVVCGWFENKNNRTLITKPSVLEKKKKTLVTLFLSTSVRHTYERIKFSIQMLSLSVL